MYIHLTKEELNYMHEAINEWHAGALEHIKKMESYTYSDDYDGYDPLPPGKCIMMTQAQIRQVNAWTNELDVNWEKNGGKIELRFFCNRILQHSVHKNMQSPILLIIQQKVENALAGKSDENSPLQKQGMFADSPKSSEQKSEKIEIPEDYESNFSDKVSTNNNNSVPNTSTSSSTSSMFTTAPTVKPTEVKIPRGFECPIALEIMEDPVICTLDFQTYERQAITDWLNKEKTSPFNRKKMADEQKIEELLIPNRALAESIQEFKQEHPELFSKSATITL